MIPFMRLLRQDPGLTGWWECAGYEFTAKAKSVVDPGWKIYDDALKAQINLERGTAGRAKNTDQGSATKALRDSQNVTGSGKNVTECHTDEITMGDETEENANVSDHHIDNIRRFSKGEKFSHPQPSLSEHFTSPPKSYSDVIRYACQEWIA